MVEIMTRIIHTHDTEENWNNLTSFIPLQGELIIYDIDENHPYQRFKLGDGKSEIKDLPFVSDVIVHTIIEERNNISYINSGRITEY